MLTLIECNSTNVIEFLGLVESPSAQSHEVRISKHESSCHCDYNVQLRLEGTNLDKDSSLICQENENLSNPIKVRENGK